MYSNINSTNSRNIVLINIKKHIITTSDYLNFELANILIKDLPDIFNINNTPYDFSVLELYPIRENVEEIKIKKPVTLVEKESLFKAESLIAKGL
jgi:hypothetical protein